MALIWSDRILVEARQVLQQVEEELRAAGVPGRVEITGPASLPGVLTKGDIDLHLRVPPDRFDDVVAGLREMYPTASLHAWTATLAVFELPATRPAGLAVTPVGSEHDVRFTTTWRRLRADPSLLGDYNRIKADHVGTPAYESSKSAFFDRIAGDQPPISPAKE